MANKITFASLKIKANEDVKEVSILNDTVKIEVKQYLSAKDKNDLIEIALQKAEENGIYNEYLLEVFFHLNIVYLYSNITFTEKQKEDELKLYDALQSNGIITAIIDTMPVEEYTVLFESIMSMKNEMLIYKNTAGAVIQSVIQDLPANAAAAKEIIDSFNPDSFKQVQELAGMATATGMNNIVPMKKE